MVTSARHEENNISLVKDGRDDSDVRQMRPSGELRVVGHKNIALLKLLCCTWTVLTPVPQLQCMGHVRLAGHPESFIRSFVDLFRLHTVGLI